MMPTILQSDSKKYNSNFMFKTPDEAKLHTWVNTEVLDMIDYARPAREIGADAIKGYMSVVYKSINFKKDRSDIVFPLMHATIYSGVILEAARAPKAKFVAQHESDEPKIKWVEDAINSSLAGGHNRPSYDHSYFEQTFDKRLFGVGPVFVGYEFTTRQTHVRDDAGKWKEVNMVVEDDIRVRNVDFFNFGVSRDMKPGMYDGRACYWDQFYDKSSFYARFRGNPFYMNVDENTIPDGDWFTGAGAGDMPKPRMWKGIYRVRHFWDIVNDLYYVQCNGIPIRWDYVLDYGNPKNPKKMLPICTTHNDIAFEYERPDAYTKFAVQNNRFYTEGSQVNTNKSFWSKPESIIAKPTIAAENTFGRSMIDWLKASSVHFVMGPTGVIDKINKGKLYGIEPIKLDGGEFTTKSLVQGSTFLQDFKVATEHLRAIQTAALGRNIFRIGDDAPTPTVASMQKEQEQKRDAQNNRYNSTGGITRMYWLFYILMQQYMVQPRHIKITDLGQVEDVEEQRIMRDADGRPVVLLQPKQIPTTTPVAEITKTRTFTVKDQMSGKDMKRMQKTYRLVDPSSPEAIKAKAKSQMWFTGKEDFLILNQDPKIVVEALSSFQEDSAIMKAMAQETLTTLVPFITMQIDGKPIIPKDLVVYIIENYAKAMGWDAQRVISMMNGDQTPIDPAAGLVPPPPGHPDAVPPPGTLPPPPTGGPPAPMLPPGAPPPSQAFGGPPPLPPPPTIGSGVPMQTAKMGSPPKPGTSTSNSPVAGKLSK